MPNDCLNAGMANGLAGNRDGALPLLNRYVANEDRREWQSESALRSRRSQINPMLIRYDSQSKIGFDPAVTRFDFRSRAIIRATRRHGGVM